MLNHLATLFSWLALVPVLFGAGVLIIIIIALSE